MNKKETYEKQLEGKLEEWRATIDRYKAEAKQASGKAQAKYYEQIDALEVQQQDVKEKLADLKSKSDDAWEDMKVGMESAWLSLSNAMKSAASQFND